MLEPLSERVAAGERRRYLLCRLPYHVAYLAGLFGYHFFCTAYGVFAARRDTLGLFRILLFAYLFVVFIVFLFAVIHLLTFLIVFIG